MKISQVPIFAAVPTSLFLAPTLLSPSSPLPSLLSPSNSASDNVAMLWKASAPHPIQTISFPISIAQSAHVAGYTYSWGIIFEGTDKFCGVSLEPRPDADGKPVMRVSLISQVKGTTTTDSNCHLIEPDNGVLCTVDLSAPYSDAFVLEMANLIINDGGSTTWTAAFVDMTTGNRVHIGTYTLPTGVGALRDLFSGSLTYVWEEPGEHPCSELKRTQVAFLDPLLPGGASTFIFAFLSRTCVGNDGSVVRWIGDGINVQLGF